MAGVIATATSGEVSTGTSPKTVFQLGADANHRVIVWQWSITFKGTSHDAAPVLVEVIGQSTTGSMTLVTPAKHDPTVDEVIQTAARRNATTEPFGAVFRAAFTVHPRTGYTWTMPPEFDDTFMIRGATPRFLGWRVTAAENVVCVVSATFEE